MSLKLRIEDNVYNYIDSITEEREMLSYNTLNNSKLNIFFHPIKTIGSKIKLNRLDNIDREFTMLMTNMNKDAESQQRIEDYIKSHPIRRNR